MNKHKVGDIVIIRKDLELDIRYGNDTFVIGMERMRGKTVKIIEITHNKKYHVSGSSYNWTDEMLLPSIFIDI